MSIEKAILRIACEGGEEFILARDEAQASSMRVSAYNIRRKLPTQIKEDVGIQKIFEEGNFYLRIFKRGVTEAQHFVRHPETGKLIPMPEDQYNPETERVVSLMIRDGKSEEEIQEFLNMHKEG